LFAIPVPVPIPVPIRMTRRSRYSSLAELLTLVRPHLPTIGVGVSVSTVKEGLVRTRQLPLRPHVLA
jgi:hypothetical protein